MPLRLPMSLMYSSQLEYLSGYADADISSTKRYSTVAVITAVVIILKALVLGNVNSSDELEIFSKPMKAHGEMQAICTI